MKRVEYSRRLEIEHELINRRITWLLTAQTILFAAYGLVLGLRSSVATLLLIIRVVGITIASGVLIGVLAAFFAKHRTWKDFTKQPGREREPFGVRTWITYLGLVPDFALPIVFVAAWVWLSLTLPTC